MFVRMLVTVTVALGTIAPEGSLTVPVIVAVSCWANAVSGKVQTEQQEQQERQPRTCSHGLSPDKWEADRVNLARDCPVHPGSQAPTSARAESRPTAECVAGPVSISPEGVSQLCSHNSWRA